MRLIEVRLLDGPNVYLRAPAVRIEIALGRRRSWYGKRLPGRYSVVRLGAAVPRADVPAAVESVRQWVARLHVQALGQRGVRPRVHRTSEPGHWVVSYPWHEYDRAESIARAAFRLAEKRANPRGAAPPASLLRSIRDANGRPPSWITDAERRVPTISISGTNGKSTTTRMIAHILRTAGRRVGMTTSDGVIVDDVMIEEGDLTGPMGAQSVLRNERVDVAVLETARGGILLRGLGFESNDASVLTNVSLDHLDLQGLHTLPELAEVKSVIAQVTKPDGAVVLNADDPLVAAVARHVRAPVAYFTLTTGGGPRVKRHLARGGNAYLYDDGWLMLANGPARRRIVAAADVPATFGGAARHNVANALAAAGGAMAMGATVDQVAEGLRTFRPTADRMPGRLNMYRNGRRLVIIDFAHNPAGVEVLLDVAEAIVGTRGKRAATLTAVIGGAGDRPDDAIHAVGKLTGSRADEVALKETLHYLRGRTRQSMLGTLRGGLAEAGVKRTDAIPVYEDEPSAVRGELTTEARLMTLDDGKPHVMVVMVHEDRPGVAGVLAELGFTPVSDPSEIADLRG